LFKPLLRIFQKTETLNELLPVVSEFVRVKRTANADTLHAKLSILIKSKQSIELSSIEIIQRIKEELEAEELPNKPQSFVTSEFGELSNKAIIQIMKDVFGAVKPKRHGDANKWIFNKSKLDKLGKIYELSLDIKVKNEDGIDGIDVGLDKHRSDNNIEPESSNNYNNLPENHEDSTQTNTEIQVKGFENSDVSSKDLSQSIPSIPSQTPNTKLEPEKAEECPNCHKMVDPYDKKHPSSCL
jgi:hypothetical protein